MISLEVKRVCVKVAPENEVKSELLLIKLQSLKIAKSKIHIRSSTLLELMLLKVQFVKVQPKNLLFEMSMSENKRPLTLRPTILSCSEMYL